VAVVHEWIASRAGSEKVFEGLAQVFPSADLFALSREPDVPMHVSGRASAPTDCDALRRFVMRAKDGQSFKLETAAARRGQPEDATASVPS
jgi:hypothetical protein